MSKELRFPKINSLVLSARLTRDVELRYTPGGTAVAKLPLAFDRSFKDKNGEWQQESSFMDATVWSQRAEQCAEQLHKGSPILIEGYLKTRQYTDKDNNNRKATEIVARKVSFLEKSGAPSESYNAPNTNQPTAPAANVTDDDVPF